jgi:hypothetical protein
VKSPISMRNGRFNTSKCSFKKWGCCTPILPKALAYFPTSQKKKFNKKISKKWRQPDRARSRPVAGERPVVARRLRVNAWPYLAVPIFFEVFFFLPSIFCTSGQLLLVGSSTCPAFSSTTFALPRLLLKTSNTHIF